MKNMGNFILFIMLLATNSSFALLSGNAQLQSQSNHSGIKVKFIANSGTAVTDSTLTDASGNYSINISGGIYYVVFSKAGYQPVYYNTNQPVILTNTVVMNSVVLNSGNVVNLSGSVSGTLVNTNVYQVNGHITIPLGSTLTINPGTVIKFNGNYSLTANGVLIAEGTDQNNEVVFTSNLVPSGYSDWQGVYNYNGASKIKFCKFECAFVGLYVGSCSIDISYCRFLKTYHAGLYIAFSSSHVHHNLFTDFRGTVYSAGIEAESCTALIECNDIHDGDGKGIWDLNSGVIRNNVIYNITNPQRGYGILSDLNGVNTTTIINNIVHDCIRTGLEVFNNITGMPEVKYINNTVYNNGDGIHTNGTTKTTIINNLVFNNVYSGIRQTWSNPDEVSHNNVWNNPTNYSGVQILGIGQPVSTNSNGDPIDSYFNISMDPLFWGGQPPYLGGGSPCYNSGKAAFSSIIGANTNLFCYGMQLGIKEPLAKTAFNVFPNPFTDQITIATNGIKTTAFIYDILGKNLSITQEMISERELKINTHSLERGIYFLEITTGNSKQTVKLIKN